jgi:stage II sporulation protein AA (anti-sigma F factor antagonist)
MKNNTLPLPLRKGTTMTSSDTIAVGSSLDVSSARGFARAIARLAQRRLSHVIVDMSKTKAVDSSGFGSLISGLKKLNEAGATPLVVCSDPSVRRLMDFAGVARMFTIVDRASDARRALAEATADALAS